MLQRTSVARVFQHWTADRTENDDYRSASTDYLVVLLAVADIQSQCVYCCCCNPSISSDNDQHVFSARTIHAGIATHTIHYHGCVFVRLTVSVCIKQVMTRRRQLLSEP